jgi:hypothetical protein
MAQQLGKVVNFDRFSSKPHDPLLLPNREQAVHGRQGHPSHLPEHFLRNAQFDVIANTSADSIGKTN